MIPDGLPAPDHYSHGTRARYVAGRCRCLPCRRANANYASQRAHAVSRGEHNGLVSAEPARLHLAELSRRGVGYKAAADAASVARSVVAKIASGAKSQIRVRTAASLLSVDIGAAADGAVIDGAETWANIAWLIEQGLTRGEIAQRIGNKTPALQIRRDRVLVTTAARIAKLRREVEEENRISQGLPEICAHCGYSHAPADRLAIVRRMLPMETRDLQEALPCFYGRGGTNGAGYAMLMRDLRALRGEVAA
jgi:hypothetical protein